jgi:predicted O-methyltransferase YrrM
MLYLAVMLVINIAVVWIAYSKLSRGNHLVRQELKEQTNNSIRQIESLLAVYAELNGKHGLPRTRGWAASPDLLALLVSVVHERGPVTVLECSSGLSTVLLAACMRNRGKGRVLSLEHDTAYAQKTRDLLSLHQLEDWAEVIYAPLVDFSMDGWSGKWYDIAALEEGLVVDLLVVDGPPKATNSLARYPALPALRSRLAKGATVVLDDADRPDEEELVRRWLAADQTVEPIHVGRFEKGCKVLRVGQAKTPRLSLA